MAEPLRHSQLPLTVDVAATAAPADTAVAGVGPAPLPTLGFSFSDAFTADLPPDAAPPAAGAPPAPPRRFGKFELLEPIAAGGMGVVFQARDTNLGRVVALKMMKNSILPEAAEVARFNREVRAAAQLEHSHIIKILEFGEVRGVPYFTMELAEGNLLRWRNGHPHDPAALVAIVEKIARAVQFAHDLNVVHRDLKPANILMMADGEPRLADFGLVKLEGASRELTGPSVMLGTPPYMAPEQFKSSKGLQKPADLWSLGVILYELLAGKLPFASSELPKLIQQIQQAAPVRPRALRPDLDAGLERIILRCLEKLPEERYPSAGALADDLARWRRGEEVRRDRWDWVRKQGRRLRRRPKTLAAVALAAALLVLGIAAGRDYLDETRPLRPARAALKRGEKATLIGPTGGPAYRRDLVGRAEVRLDPAGTLPFEMKSIGHSVVELFPAPLPVPFRLEAEVCHLSGAGDCEVGLYCMSSDHRQAGRQELSLLALSHDERSERTVELAPHRLPAPQEAGAGRLLRFTGLLPARELPGPPTPDSATRWRRLVVEIDTLEARGHCDGEPLGALSRDKVVRYARLNLTSFPSGAFVPDRVFLPEGGVGLLVRRGLAQFRNVAIIPLVQPSAN